MRCLPVSDLDRSLVFYERLLEPLGMCFLSRDADAIGFGVDTWQFGIVKTLPPIPVLHLAFRAQNRATVDRFYEEALAAGGISNGAPGIRPVYDPEYYAAFIRDPDGHNIEAVCRYERSP
jgi:catechol 2,3-dioxygenase-like lactoylglutathione lyase family enzyme